MSIQEIKAVFDKRGVQRSNRFKVNFSGLSSIGIGSSDDHRDMSTCIETVSIPGRQIQTFGYDMFRHPSEIPTGYVNEGLIITFVVPADMFIKHLFDKWIELVVDPTQYKMRYPSEYHLPLLQVEMFNSQDKTVYTVDIDSVFPKAIKAIGLAQNDSELTKFTVEFAYNDLRFPKGVR